MAKEQFLGTGRRKKSIARVRLIAGKGNITINKRDIEEYFGYETLKMIAKAPLTLTETAGKYDVFVNVRGGYHGWSFAGVPNPCNAAFVILNHDCGRRSNVLSGRWTR